MRALQAWPSVSQQMAGSRPLQATNQAFRKVNKYLRLELDFHLV